MMGCSPPAAAPLASASIPLPRDMATYANIDAFVTKHLLLDLTADFESKTLRGTAELQLERRDPRATEIVLDTRDLQIQKTETASGTGSWSDTAFRLDQPTPAFGSALRVTVPANADRVRITYASSPSAKGLQWLTPAQTSGKKQPFLFSQAQAIQARSFIPLQDTPAVRMTYDATIRVPKDLVAVMAAEAAPGEKGSGVFRFRMPQAIPSYLIALAVGDLTFKAMSDRTGVWAEPAMVDAAAKGVRRHGADDQDDRGALRPVPLGSLRAARASAVVSIRWHGESARHVRHADGHRRRQVSRRARRARTGPFVVGQPGDQRHVERLLVERRLHHLSRTAHRRGGVRQAARGHGTHHRSSRSRSGASGRHGARRSHAPARLERARSGRCVFGGAVRAGRAISVVPGGEVRARAVRSIPAALVRRARVSERQHGPVPRVPDEASACRHTPVL